MEYEMNRMNISKIVKRIADKQNIVIPRLQQTVLKIKTDNLRLVLLSSSRTLCRFARNRFVDDRRGCESLTEENHGNYILDMIFLGGSEIDLAAENPYLRHELFRI